MSYEGYKDDKLQFQSYALFWFLYDDQNTHNTSKAKTAVYKNTSWYGNAKQNSQFITSGYNVKLRLKKWRFFMW